MIFPTNKLDSNEHCKCKWIINRKKKQTKYYLKCLKCVLVLKIAKFNGSQVLCVGLKGLSTIFNLGHILENYYKRCSMLR